MAFEVERRFLVKGDALRGMAEPVRIRKGYVPTTDGANAPFITTEIELPDENTIVQLPE